MQRGQYNKSFVGAKNEVKDLSLTAWTHWYHKPYKSDWIEARGQAIDRRWQIKRGED